VETVPFPIGAFNTNVACASLSCGSTLFTGPIIATGEESVPLCGPFPVPIDTEDEVVPRQTTGKHKAAATTRSTQLIFNTGFPLSCAIFGKTFA
jgi:hypothetical protein